MTNMMLSKHDLVEDVLNLIPDSRVRKGLLEIVDILPTYFFTVPSSATGRHHPSYALGKGGLLRHCKAATRIGYDLMENPLVIAEKTDTEKSLILAAIFVHDGLKLGKEHSLRTAFDHPILMQKFLIENKDRIPSLSEEELTYMGDLIKTHMGPWTKDPETKQVVLEEPKTPDQLFVHLCDYLSSRKEISFKFDESWQLILE